MSNRLHHQRIDDYLHALVPIAEAAAMKIGKGRVHVGPRPDRDIERRIAAGGAQSRTANQLDTLRTETLLDQRVRRSLLELGQRF